MKPFKLPILSAVACFLFPLALFAKAENDFYLKGGETVIFVGDGIHPNTCGAGLLI